MLQQHAPCTVDAESFLEFANHLPEAMLLVSPDGAILAANEGVRTRLGLAPEGLAGRPLAESVAEPSDCLIEYLRCCSRSREMVLGSLTVAGINGSKVPCRVEGRAFQPCPDGCPASVLLRLTPEVSSDPTTRSTTSDDIPLDDRPEARANILLVDDNPANLLALEAVLEDLGHNLVKAASGHEALRLLADQDFAVVLLDVRLDGLDGFETAKLIRSRERSRHTPIIFFTAHDDNRLSVEAAYALGAVDYLVTPLVPVILRSKVAGFVELFGKTEQVKRQAEQLRLMERRRFEQTLAEENARVRESEERFRQLAENISKVFWMSDPRKSQVLYVSPAYEAIWGRSCGSLYERPLSFFDAVHPEDREHVRTASLEPQGRGERADVEYRVVRPDGSVRWVRDRSFPVKDQSGQVYRMAGIAEDITERRLAEESLRASEQRFKALASHAPVGIFQTDAEGNCLFVNGRWCEMAGMTPDEARGQGWVAALHPEDRVRIFHEWYAAAKEGREFACEYRFRTPQGRVTWLSGSAVALRDGAGSHSGYIGTVTNITERKQAEAELAHLAGESQRRRRLYEAALSNTPDLVYVFDLDHRFTYANEGLLRMWGKTWGEAIGKNCLELGYEPWHAAMHDREIEQVVATRQPVKGEVPFTGTFGPRVYEYIFVPVLGEQGEVEAVAGTTRDVTERKAQEERLRDQAERLREADRRKDEFLAMLAHELRNPLAPIRNAVQVLRLLGPADPNLQRARDMIERQVQQMTRIVDDLLDASRITRGKVTLQKEPVELATVVARAVETSRPLIDARRHELSVTLPREPLRVEADATRLAQVISNLLNNAAKYTKEGGHIGLAVEAGAGEAVVRVRDDGVGVPAGLLPHLFDLFTQGDRSLARSEGGLGIGLTLVKSLVGMHGGRVEAQSEGPDKGSEFVVRLPTLSGEPALVAEGGEGGPSNAPPSPSRRVLVVDDNVDAAESLAMMLRAWGHEVRTAYDGVAALNAAEQVRPEVILLDIGLPRMDGYEVARRLRERDGTRGVLLVALTGYGQEEDRRRAKEAGFDAHLTKPADTTTLQRLVAGTEVTK